MDFVIIYFFCILTSFCIYCYGYLINKIVLKYKSVNFFENIIIGFIFLSFLALFLNFFFSLNTYINTGIFFIAFVIAIFLHKSLNIVEIITKLSLISLIGFLTFILDHSNRPDAGLYHLPFISILNSEKIIFGSVNLQFRYGHISSLQYIYSLFNNYIFKDNGILIPLTILYSSVILFFYTELKKNLNGYLKLYSLLALIFILTSMNRYSGFGNDDPAHMLYLISTYYFIKFYLDGNKQENFNLVAIYCLYTFLIKQFYVLIVFLPLIIIFSNFKKIEIFNRSNIFGLFFLCLWLLKNILTTSCVLYPVNLTCIDTLKWSPKNTFSSATRVSLSSEAWAKAYPDRLDKQRDYVKHLSDYQWIVGWYQNHAKIVLKKILPLIIFMLLIFVFLRANKKSRTYKKNEKSLYLILLLNLLFSIIWFLKFPTYRYGAAYLGTFFITIGLLVIKDLNILESSKKVVNGILAVIVVFVLTKNSIRIIENYNINYTDFPWPKKNSFTEENNKNDNLPVIKNNVIIYYTANPYPLCMYSKSPCTSFKDLKVKREINRFNYKVFIPEVF